MSGSAWVPRGAPGAAALAICLGGVMRDRAFLAKLSDARLLGEIRERNEKAEVVLRCPVALSIASKMRCMFFHKP